jgi:two-component system response regulator NreC
VPPRADRREEIFGSGKIRCIVANDHVLLRQGLHRLLQDEPDIEVVSEAGNAAECLRKVHQMHPDVLLADAETFGLPAREAELLVAEESSLTKVIFLTQEETSLPFVAMPVAAGNCTTRQTSAEELVQMVRNTRAGGRMPEAFLRHDPPRPAQTQFPQERALTGREREVLKLLAEGKTVRAAAEVLGLSSKTVDAHKFNLMRKLGIHNKAELVMWAIQKRILKVPANF